MKSFLILGILIAGSALISQTFAILIAAQTALGSSSELQIPNSAQAQEKILADHNQANFKLVSRCSTYTDNSPITPGSCSNNNNSCYSTNELGSSNSSQLDSDKTCLAPLQSQSANSQH
jgi:hypothetical protein